MSRYVIIGASAAGVGALNTLVKHAQNDEIVCITAENVLPYNKCFLAEYASAVKTYEQIVVKNKNFFDEHSICYETHARVVRIIPETKQVILHHGRSIAYDALLIATGTLPRIPVIEGVGQYAGVFTFHYGHDVKALRAYVDEHKPRKAVIIGGGLSGLEAADALMNHGVMPIIVEAGTHLMTRHVDEKGHAYLTQHMHTRGIQITCNTQIVRLDGVHGKVSRVICADGSSYDTDCVVIAAGGYAETAMFEDAGLACLQGGIVVDQYMRTNIENIWAAGDVCVVSDALTGEPVRSCLWPDAMAQGMHAASAMVGNPKAYSGAFVVTSSSFFGQRFAAYGSFSSFCPTFNVHRYEDDVLGYRLFVINDQGKLVGYILIGAAKNSGRLRRAVLTQESVSPELLDEWTR